MFCKFTFNNLWSLFSLFPRDIGHMGQVIGWKNPLILSLWWIDLPAGQVQISNFVTYFFTFTISTVSTASKYFQIFPALKCLFFVLETTVLSSLCYGSAWRLTNWLPNHSCTFCTQDICLKLPNSNNKYQPWAISGTRHSFAKPAEKKNRNDISLLFYWVAFIHENAKFLVNLKIQSYEFILSPNICTSKLESFKKFILLKIKGCTVASLFILAKC